MHAGTAELQQAAHRADEVEHRLQVVFGGRIETAMLLGDAATQQTIGADHLFAGRTIAVEHHQVVALGIELVEVEAETRHLGRRLGGHLLVEDAVAQPLRSEEHTSELQSLMRNSYAVLCLKKKQTTA